MYLIHFVATAKSGHQNHTSRVIYIDNITEEWIQKFENTILELLGENFERVNVLSFSKLGS